LELAVLVAGDVAAVGAVVVAQAVFSQLVIRMGSKRRDNFMIYSLCDALGLAMPI
jgi:hypothetical protein